MKRPSKPQLCFTGPLLGRNTGHVISQGEILALRFREQGYSAICTSSSTNRCLRWLDMIVTLVRCHRQIDIQCIQVFSGLGFIYADIASWLRRTLGQKIIMVLRGGNLPSFSARHKGWVRRVLSRADVVSAPSAYLACDLKEWRGNVHVVPNVIILYQYPFRLRENLSGQLFYMRTVHPIL